MLSGNGTVLKNGSYVMQNTPFANTLQIIIQVGNLNVTYTVWLEEQIHAINKSLRFYSLSLDL